MPSPVRNDEGNWWSRPCGGREVLAIALPLVISTGSFSIMLFADRMFLLWHSSAEMAASMPAGTLYWTLLCFPLGVASYANTFVAQYFGAAKHKRIGLVTWQAFRIGLYVTPLFLCVLPLARPFFVWAGHSSPVLEYEVVYFQTLMFAAGAAVMSESLGAFFTGRGVTRVVMYVNVAASGLNIVLDYILIFGCFGLPEMGMEGAGWATVIATWFKLVVYWWLVQREAEFNLYGLGEGRRFAGGLLRRLFFFGAPSGLQFVVEAGSFCFITIAMARFGETAMAATTLAFNVNAVAFIPLIGIGIAVSTLVGQQLMKGRADLATRATWTAVVLAIIYNTPFIVAYVTVPSVFMIGHASGVEASRFAEIEALAIVLIRFVAAYAVFDAMQILFAAAIKGAGDTWFVLLNAATVSLTAILIGWIGSQAGGELLWWWWVVTGWICALGVTFLARFLQGRWRTMQVIERDPIEPAAETGGNVSLATAD